MACSKMGKLAMVGAATGGAFLGWKFLKSADLEQRNRSLQRGRKIVILGAGFGGLNVAQELSRLLPAHGDAEITVIDHNNFLLFTPMLAEVAGGQLDARHIVAPPRQLSKRIRFRQGKVTGVDLHHRSVVLDTGDGENSTCTVTADHIVIALGSVPKFHSIPGVQEHSLPVKTIGDAAAIRNQALTCLERASWQTNPEIRREILTFVVGGGGYTGVEIMAAINDLLRESVRHYPSVRPEEIRTVIAEPSDRLLAELSPDLASFAQQKLQERGVEVLLKTKITGATGKYVEFDNGKRISTHTLIWAGGVAPNPLIGKLDCDRGHHGGIVVDECCAVADPPGIWAIGDCAEVPKSGSQGTYAPTAQNATREGELVARNIVAVLRGEQPKPFTFKEIGELALVGKHTGVAKIYGQHFSGFVAWAMWRAIYLSKMPGLGQRARILVDWLLDFAFGRNIAEFPVDRSGAASQGK